MINWWEVEDKAYINIINQTYIAGNTINQLKQRVGVTNFVYHLKHNIYCGKSSYVWRTNRL